MVRAKLSWFLFYIRFVISYRNQIHRYYTICVYSNTILTISPKNNSSHDCTILSTQSNSIFMMSIYIECGRRKKKHSTHRVDRVGNGTKKNGKTEKHREFFEKQLFRFLVLSFTHKTLPPTALINFVSPYFIFFW